MMLPTTKEQELSQNNAPVFYPVQIYCEEFTSEQSKYHLPSVLQEKFNLEHVTSTPV